LDASAFSEEFLPKMKSRLASLIFLSVCAFAFAQESDHDNRFKPGLKVGDTIPDYVPEVYPTQAELLTKIAGFHEEALTQALGQFMELKWIRRVALRDADYILCLFDSSVRVEPGDNPRVLLLLTPDYQLKTWGRFTNEPSFASGHIVSPLHQTSTWFITVNSASRSGGTLSFEKYLIEPGGIRRLGSSNELTKIPDH